MADISAHIDPAVKLLKANDLVAIPTETVYGLAGNALNETTISKIFAVKRRPKFDPLIAHVGDERMLEKLVHSFPEKAQRLAEKFWPGPLTLLLSKREDVPDLLTSGSERVAVRMPNHPLTLELLQQLDFPLAAPSANPFGYVSPTTAQHVADQLGPNIPYILDGGPCTIGLESSIVGFEGEDAIVYRLGGLPLEEIQKVIGPVKVNLNKSSNPQAPGMLKSHYSPGKPVILGEIEALINEHRDQQIGIIAFDKKYGNFPQVTLSTTGDMQEAAANLFKALRELDTDHVDVILAEQVPDHGLGRAINDRLERAAAK
ncbi:MAG: L-threonylcarbamoyladenylate synthase [Cytophagales bacterium]|nr:L-threonylcarbamoyladenylate synthase [Cytophagales bacterium]